MIPIPYIPLLSVSTWLGLFRRKVRRTVKPSDRKTVRLFHCLTVFLFLAGCTVEPAAPISPPALPFPRTEITERQRAYQEAKKADPNLPPRTGMVLR